jgi:threonine/homoserine/homoserine lactone efflux protein
VGRAAPADESRGRALAEESPSARSHWSSFRTGLATIAANPKGAVFSVVSAAVRTHDAPVVPSMLVLGVVWAVIDGSWCVFVAWGVSHARQVLARPRVRLRLEQLTGFVLIALGVRLATDGR